jgi:hypothetical protein
VTNEILKTLGVPILGMVVNGVTAEEVGYGYGYGYGYGGYGYGGYGYGKKNRSPYGPSDEAPINGNGSLPHDLNPFDKNEGKLGHENFPADPLRR